MVASETTLVKLEKEFVEKMVSVVAETNTMPEIQDLKDDIDSCCVQLVQFAKYKMFVGKPWRALAEDILKKKFEDYLDTLPAIDIEKNNVVWVSKMAHSFCVATIPISKFIRQFDIEGILAGATYEETTEDDEGYESLYEYFEDDTCLAKGWTENNYKRILEKIKEKNKEAAS